MMKIPIKLLSKTAKVPTKSHDNDAGFDLYADDNCIHISSNISNKFANRVTISTGIAVAIPNGYFGLIKDRSGLAAKHGLHVLAGVIDAGYRGEIKVCIINTSDSEYYVVRSDRIAQLLILPVPDCEFNVVGELDDSERNIKGFGSSGS